MTVVDARADKPSSAQLQAEWERVEWLIHCAQSARAGKAPPEQHMRRLRALQQEVERLRGHTLAWSQLEVSELTRMEHDVLAVVIAAEADPRIGWMLQGMQASGGQPHPTLALLHELLAVHDDEVGELRRALSSESTLRRRHLVSVERDGLSAAIRAGRHVVAQLLGWPVCVEAPPGAVRVRQRASWDDLVLAGDRAAALKEFLYWIRYRDTVVTRWGASATGGPVALFAGPSGTGKTFAALVIAGELGWPLYRVDLGRLVSKYIGETEKNLNRLFDAANDADMVLQFDEADSLMSKRGEVKEARDRFANMQVSHLLARIEEHRGPCILTTNLRSHLDSAFYRRFQVVVEFPRPDAVARAELWRRLLPPRAPIAPDVDCDLLGEGIRMSGGSIRNAALHAAYCAAAHARCITRADIAVAVWRELAKDGREVSDSDMGPLIKDLPASVRPKALVRKRSQRGVLA